MPVTRSPLAALGATLLLALAPAATRAADATTTAAAPAPAAASATAAPTPEELQHLIIRDVKIGEGDEARVGNIVDMQYTGWLFDAYAPQFHGKQFDSSAGRGPFTFMLGVGDVITGWDRGVPGMKVGGKRILIIPSYLAYGERGAGQDIPPGATLIFDIELVKLK